MTELVLTTDIKEYPLMRRGKVRDIYDLGDTLLFVASDRISAFDVVMPNGIPEKGRVLTQMSLFWFDFLKDVVANHLVTAKVDEYPVKLRPYRSALEGRSMIVVKGQEASVPTVSAAEAGQRTTPGELAPALINWACGSRSPLW